VVEGEFEMTIDGVTERIGPGQTVHVPAGVVHCGTNVGPGAGRRILTFNPSGMEEFFREAGADAPDAEPDLDAVRDVAIRHGWRFSAS
jgi:quercetin dioxygenase-like cupin family protein